MIVEVETNYQQALNHLNSCAELPPKGVEWSLENIISAIDYLGLKSKKMPSIQVVGTNGKGSTAFFIAKILEGHHWRVGLYTKPHLCMVRERISINGVYISEEDFGTLYLDLLPVFGKFKLSYFEKLTLLAFYYFVQKNVQYAVFETGLGGRLDAVTAIGHAITVFTSIGIDHTDRLGNTLEDIVQEKSAVLQYSQLAFSTIQSPLATSLLQKQAEVYQKPIRFMPDITDIDITLEGTKYIFKGEPYSIPMFGAHYARNANLALTTASYVLRNEFSLDLAKQSLQHAFWKGRLEFIKKEGYRQILLSCAHNEDSLIADLSTIQLLIQKHIIQEKFDVLFAVSRERPADKFMELLLQYLPLQNLQITVTIIPPYSAPYNLLKEKLGSDTPIKFLPDCQQAMDSLLLPVDSNLVLVIGSIYLCGKVLQYLDGLKEK